MKKLTYSLIIAGAIAVIIAASNRHDSLRDGFVNGTADVKSISALTFGPDGVLFIGDSRSASVFAIDTKDVGKVEKATAVELKKFDQKIAGALGTTVDNITLQDVVVNPISKN